MKAKLILIVDDDLDDREMLEEAIKEITDEVTIIAQVNGKEALQWLQRNEQLPEFIFLDLNMPQLNGMQCLKRIRKDERFREIPVIIYTTSKLQEDKKKALELGASCFLTKPNSFKSLKKMIGQVIKKEWSAL